ncbi:MAG: AarF/UbiB family protein [Oscillospiraceae bacterium]|jgi:ubiquinone biosynthesis protein|nr:AarF/UbiB family protein [Oscillospiraceae bacterium]
MPNSKAVGSGERLQEIFSVLRKHQVVKGLTPEKLRLVFEDLGPTFVKFGQIMSLRPDILPRPYCEELSRLRTNVRPMSYEEAAAVVEKELGKPLEELFARFDSHPVGSASIAQVHYAELKNGAKVVVKIRRPGIYEVMERDVALLHRISPLLKIVGGTGNAIDFNQVIQEMWHAAQEEMNFLNEASQAEEFRRMNRGIAYVTSPRIYRAYSTVSVLVMEYLDGIAIDDVELLKKNGYDLDEIGTKLAENYVKQIVDDGFFHADPHPGNLKIRDGRIVWLDMGMMGRLSQRDRHLFKRALGAAVRGDVNELCNLLMVFCEPAEPIDRSRLYTDIDNLMNRYETLDVGSMNLLNLRDDIMAVANRNAISMPRGFSMLGRGLVTIEGVVSQLSPNINVMQIMVNHLSGKFLDDFDPVKETQKAWMALLQSGRRVPRIPSQVSELLKMGIKGQTKTNIEITGSEQPLRALGKMAERISIGLIEGGLLIASAILSTSDLPKCFLGIPTAGAVGFLAALAIGIWFLWGMFRKSG